MVPMPERTCSLCGATKPTSEFYKRSGRDSLYAHCKRCHIDMTKDRANARQRALQRLARAHRKEFRQYLREEMAHIGRREGAS